MTFWRFLQESHKDKINSLELDSLNNFGRLWTIGLVPSYLVPRSGIFKREEIYRPDRGDRALYYL